MAHELPSQSRKRNKGVCVWEGGGPNKSERGGWKVF